jgi:hypothetical protein
MKVYKVTLLVVDHDELGEDGIREEIGSVRYPNHRMSPQVMKIESRESRGTTLYPTFGAWRDSHALNLAHWSVEAEKLFK